MELPATAQAPSVDGGAHAATATVPSPASGRIVSAANRELAQSAKALLAPLRGEAAPGLVSAAAAAEPPAGEAGPGALRRRKSTGAKKRKGSISDAGLPAAPLPTSFYVGESKAEGPALDSRTVVPAAPGMRHLTIMEEVHFQHFGHGILDKVLQMEHTIRAQTVRIAELEAKAATKNELDAMASVKADKEHVNALHHYTKSESQKIMDDKVRAQRRAPPPHRLGVARAAASPTAVVF